MSWFRKNVRVLVLITASVASLPFIPEWARVVASAGSQILEKSDLPQN